MVYMTSMRPSRVKTIKVWPTKGHSCKYWFHLNCPCLDRVPFIKQASVQPPAS